MLRKKQLTRKKKSDGDAAEKDSNSEDAKTHDQGMEENVISLGMWLLENDKTFF